MLKISVISTSHESTTVQLDGNVSGQWVDELRHIAEAVLAESRMLVIDCRGVSFSDSLGQHLMRQLLVQKVSLINCPPFFQSQLEDS